MASPQLSLNFLREVLIEQSGAGGAPLVMWLGLFLWGLVTCGHKRRVLLILVWIGASFAFLSMVEPSHPVRTRYVIFPLPIHLLVITRGLMSLGRLLNCAFVRMSGDGNRRLAFSHTLAVLILGALSVAPLRDCLSWQKEDWRSAIEYLLENVAGGHIIIADGQGYRRGADSDRTSNGLEYYFFLRGQEVTVLQPQRGLLRRMETGPDPGAGAWGVLWHTRDLASLQQVGPDIEILQFPRVTVIGLLNPSGDMVENAGSVLRTLLMVQPRREGRFDLHLALAETYLQSGRLDEARLELDLASQVKPDNAGASGDFKEALLEFDLVSHTTQDPLQRNVGHLFALLQVRSPHGDRGGWRVTRGNTLVAIFERDGQRLQRFRSRGGPGPARMDPTR
ncbi:MAG: hypothetical protein GTO63_36770 [Anaerolineae bacterium]|nr:hypothetical protein [Anaerolineae bacterium]NIO00308.1 hypothetical protein [Anaerolineae bacterium]